MDYSHFPPPPRTQQTNTNVNPQHGAEVSPNPKVASVAQQSLEKKELLEKISQKVRTAQHEHLEVFNIYSPSRHKSYDDQIKDTQNKLAKLMNIIFPTTKSFLEVSAIDANNLRTYLQLKYQSFYKLDLYKKLENRIETSLQISGGRLIVDPRFQAPLGQRIDMMTIPEAMTNIRDFDKIRGSDVVKQAVKDIIHHVYNGHSLQRLRQLLKESTFSFNDQSTTKTFDQLSPEEKKDITYFYAIATSIEQTYEMLEAKKG